MTFGFSAGPHVGKPLLPTIWFQPPWVCAPMGVNTRMLVSSGEHVGRGPAGPPAPVASTGTPAQWATSIRTVTLAFSVRTRSGAGLPAAADWAHVGNPVVPPRYGSQQAKVVARMRVPLLELPTMLTVCVPGLGAFG